jgi:hypothetical protein
MRFHCGQTLPSTVDRCPVCGFVFPRAVASQPAVKHTAAPPIPAPHGASSAAPAPPTPGGATGSAGTTGGWGAPAPTARPARRRAAEPSGRVRGRVTGSPQLVAAPRSRARALIVVEICVAVVAALFMQPAAITGLVLGLAMLIALPVVIGSLMFGGGMGQRIFDMGLRGLGAAGRAGGTLARRSGGRTALAFRVAKPAGAVRQVVLVGHDHGVEHGDDVEVRGFARRGQVNAYRVTTLATRRSLYSAAPLTSRIMTVFAVVLALSLISSFVGSGH